MKSLPSPPTPLPQAGEGSERLPLDRIEELAVFEDLGEDLLSCADGEAWLARLARVNG